MLWNNRCTTGSLQEFVELMKFCSISIFSLMAAGLLGSSALVVSARAADVSVSAELSQPEISSGEMAELQVKVTGADAADVPQQIAVDGLQIRLTGQSTQVQMVNFKVSSSVVYSYVVMPLRTGNFTIPTIPVRTSAGLARTRPLSFTVSDGSSGTPPATQPQPQSQSPFPGMPGFSQPQPQTRDQEPDPDHIAFGEISCPKKTIYVGEMVPVEIRYYFDARYSAQVRSGLNFGSEGIIVERFPEPKESREDRDGITYNVLSFHTLLSAIQPGSLDIPPAKLESQIQMPGSLPPGFDDPVFQQLLGSRASSQSRNVTVATAPLHLEVLALPKEGRPASFAGAVGQFDIDASVPNPNPAPGDPAGLTIKIAGKGNFNAMSAPQLTNTEGWRTYPPGEKFEGNSEKSSSGVKTYDFTLIAQQPRKHSPGSVFSYFDPAAKKYVTLTTEPLPLDASPGNSQSAPAVSLAQATPAPQPASTPSAPLSGPQPLPGISLHSWQTPMQRVEFLIATASLLVATLSLAGILQYYKIQSGGGTPASRRRRRAAELLANLNSGSLDAGSAYEAALEYASLVPADEGKRESIITILAARRDVLKYGLGGSAALTESERNRLIETLRDLSSKTSQSSKNS